MQSVNRDAAQNLAKCLIDRHSSGVSWRGLEKVYGVAAGTLCRIAKSGGEWLPKDHKILRQLGLVETRTRTEVEKRIGRMARETKKQILKDWRKP